MREKTYRAWQPDQAWLLPPSPQDWLSPSLRFCSFRIKKPPIGQNAILQTHFIAIGHLSQVIAFHLITTYLMVVHLAILSIPQYSCGPESSTSFEVIDSFPSSLSISLHRHRLTRHPSARLSVASCRVPPAPPPHVRSCRESRRSLPGAIRR